MARVKKKAHENLTNANIRHVSSLLTPTSSGVKSITKKEACAILNITYNTTRLQRIIDELQEHDEFVAKRKSQNRGKRATDSEITQTVTEYLAGEPVSKIAKSLFRSAGFVNGIIGRVGVPTRVSKTEGRAFDYLPDACIADRFIVDQIVWSAKYHSAAIIVQKLEESIYQDKYGSDCYQISIIEPVDASESYFKHIEAGGYNAFALAYDLGSLEHLTEYGVDLTRI